MIHKPDMGIVDQIRWRRPDPIADRIIITVDEMNEIASSIYVYENRAEQLPGGPVYFDFTDVSGNKYSCIVMTEPDATLGEVLEERPL